MELAYITDPSHGWLLVTTGQLEQLGMGPENFSRYSYRYNDVLALEEDSDMSLFLAEYERQRGEMPLIKARHLERDAFVRDWASL